MTAKQFPEDAVAAADHADLIGLAGWRRWPDAVRGAAMVGLTATILAILIWHVEPQAVADAAADLPAGAWIASLCIAIAFPAVSTTRWWVMARTMGAPQPWRLLLRASLGIAPVNVIAPSKSGDLLRILALRGRMEGAQVLGGLLVERAMDMAVLAFFVLAGGLISGRPVFAVLSVAVFVAVFAILAMALAGARISFGPRLTPKVKALSATLRQVLRQPVPLLVAGILTTLHWSLVGILVTVLLAGGGAPASPLDTMVAMPMSILVGMVPVTIAGMGTREGAMLVLFADAAAPSQILAAGLLYTALVYWLPALAGLAFTRSVLRPERTGRPASHPDPTSMQA